METGRKIPDLFPNLTKRRQLTQVTNHLDYGEGFLSFHHILQKRSTVRVHVDIKELPESSSIKKWK